jgi:hypothetical protein
MRQVSYPMKIVQKRLFTNYHCAFKVCIAIILTQLAWIDATYPIAKEYPSPLKTVTGQNHSFFQKCSIKIGLFETFNLAVPLLH